MNLLLNKEITPKPPAKEVVKVIKTTNPQVINDSVVKTPKKRGRKPKGGKIIQQQVTQK